MFINNFDPVLLNLGPLEIRYYGLVYVLALILLLLTLNYYRKKQVLTLTKEEVYDLVFYIGLGAILGARVFHVLFWGFSYYLANPLDLFAVWKGGMSFHGGVVGIALATYLYAKKKKINIAQLADMITLPILVTLILGRIANFFNHELYGTVTNLPWCVQFNNVDGCRHPYQLYASLKWLIVLLILLPLKNKKHGFIFWMFLLLTSIGRLVLDFVRVDTIYGGLKMGQWLSIGAILLSGYVLIKYYRSKE